MALSSRVTDANLDTLSPLGRKVMRLDAPDTYQQLVIPPGSADRRAELLRDLTPRDLLDGKIVDENAAACVLAGLWLRFDALDQSHKICQAIETPEGSFWHAIVHRREGDFSNSKYWFDRVGPSPLYKTMAARASEVINPFPADKSVYRLTVNGWNAAALVDLVAAVAHQPDDPRHTLAVAIQQIEWQVLFEHCRRIASGM